VRINQPSPYDSDLPAPRPRPPQHEPSPRADVEVSVRVFVDGGSITTVRRLSPADGTAPRRTIGIDAVIR